MQFFSAAIGYLGSSCVKRLFVFYNPYLCGLIKLNCFF